MQKTVYDEKFWQAWEELHPESFQHLLEDLQRYLEWKKARQKSKERKNDRGTEKSGSLLQ